MISLSYSQTAAGIAFSCSKFSCLLSDAKKFFGLRGSWGFLGRAIFLPGLGDQLWTVCLQGGAEIRWGLLINLAWIYCLIRSDAMAFTPQKRRVPNKDLPQKEFLVLLTDSPQCSAQLLQYLGSPKRPLFGQHSLGVGGGGGRGRVVRQMKGEHGIS